MKYHRRAGKISKSEGNEYLTAVSMQHLAELHNELGEFAKALFFFQKALNLYIVQNRQIRIASVYMNMGKLWYNREYYNRAYIYFDKAEKSMLRQASSDMLSDLMLYKGKVAGKLGKYENAQVFLEQAELLAKEQSQHAVLSECQKALAELYADLGKYETAYAYQEKYIRKKDTLFDKELSATMAHEEALFRHKSRLKDIELLESKEALYEIESNYQKKEIKVKTLYITVLLIVLGILLVAAVYAYLLAVKNRKTNARLQLKNRLINEQNNEITQQNEEIRAQTDQLFNANKSLTRFKTALKNTNNSVVIMDDCGEFLWVNNGFTKLYGMTKKEFRKQNLNIFDAAEASDNAVEIKQKVLACIEDKSTEHYEFSTIGAKGKRVWVQTTITPLVNENNETESLIAIDSDITEIKQYEEKLKIITKKVLEQKNVLQKQNMEINAAIRYAGTIQKAILPIPEYIQRDIDFFLIYKPKEIVSGDFYWFSNPVDVPYVFIAITDCTGHGVPGAFMSMIGTRLLNSIVNEKSIYDPAEILERMHQSIKQTLKQHTTGNMDGMDISLCRLEPVSAKQKKITFSGAKQSAFYHKMHSGKIVKVRGDIKTIGGLYYDEIHFTNKSFVLETGDMLYLTSDGIIDQNAPNRKKFGTIRMIQLLEEIADLPLSKQKKCLLTAYENHRKGQPQRDDISFLGIRL
jgi:PAS domain S-box-containing protein